MNPMMVPNPFQMYGSVNPVPVQDPMGLFAAYQTVNPAMYYGSYNPQQLYSSVSTVPSLVQPMSNTQAAMAPSTPNTTPNQSAEGIGAQMVPQVMVPNQQMMMQQRVVPPAQLPAAQIASPAMNAQPNTQALVPNISSLPQSGNANALSFYGTVPGGQNQMMASNNPSSVVVPPAQQQVPASSPEQMAMAPMVPQAFQSNNVVNEAAKMQYQSAMQQAAAAYHNAASAYRSISGQTPVDLTNQASQATMAPPPPLPQTQQQQQQQPMMQNASESGNAQSGA